MPRAREVAHDGLRDGRRRLESEVVQVHGPVCETCASEFLTRFLLPSKLNRQYLIMYSPLLLKESGARLLRGACTQKGSR